MTPDDIKRSVDSGNFMEEAWKEFNSMVHSTTMPEVVTKMMKQAFYSGMLVIVGGESALADITNPEMTIRRVIAIRTEVSKWAQEFATEKSAEAAEEVIARAKANLQ